MIDPQRIEQLKQALEQVEDASTEEKEILFGGYITALKEHDLRFEDADNRFDPYSSHAYQAMGILGHFFRRTTGYNAGWVSERFMEHCSDEYKRTRKYDFDTRQANCIFIGFLVARGASETQAMKLLMRLHGDTAMSEGHLRELRDTFRDFKKLGRPAEYDLSIPDNAYYIADFLKFDISNLIGDEKASEKAIEAFRMLFQEVIDIMKDNHQLVATRDSSYPDIFGPVIQWIEADYEDPLSYFYEHETHKSVPFHQRRRCLSEYLNTVHCFLEHPKK